MRVSYPTYKSTSIPWLPEMPEHWDLIGLNLLFRDNKNKNKGMVESLVLSLSYGNIIRKQREENFGLIPVSFETYQILEPGYIVMRLTDLQNDKRSLRVGYVKERGIITSAYTGLVPGKVDSKYYYYLLHYLDIRKHFYSLGGGVRQSSDYNEIKKTKVPLPPLPEQTAIANYLDAKTEQINRFIAKKEKLIALLKEQKQAVINELLEDKEGKWERMKLKFVSNVNKLSLGEKTNPEFEFTYLDISSVDEGGNQSENIQKIKFKDAPSRARRVVRKGDVIISTVRTYLQSITFFDSEVEDIIVSTGYAVLTPRQKTILPEFLNFAVRKKEVLDEIMANSTGITYPAITSIKLSNFKISVPSIDEQLEIIKQINTETNRILTVIGRIEREIEIVKELKQSLIAEVVTGRIKVA
jgi:type I restriction enzyme S subunit